MTETNEPTNATPDPIQLPSQDPVQTPTAEAPSPVAPRRTNRKLLAGIAGAAALIAVAGVSGYAIGNAADDRGGGDQAGVSRFEADGAPGSPDSMRGGPDGMQGKAHDGHFGEPDGDRRGHRHHEGNGPDMPGPDSGGPADVTPSAPVTPSS